MTSFAVPQPHQIPTVRSGHIGTHLTAHLDLVYVDGLHEPILNRNFDVEQVRAGLSYGF